MDEHERREVGEFWEVGEDDYFRVVRGEEQPTQLRSEFIDLAYVEKVFAQSDDYIVYLSSEKRLRMAYDGSEPRGFAQAWAEAQHLQSLGKMSLTNTEEMDYFLSRIAAGLSVAFEGEVGLGMEALRQVREYIRDRKEGESRRRYALMTMITGIAAVMLGATVAGFASVGETAAGDGYAGLVGLSLIGGGLGTFLATNNGRATPFL